jgi:hypothetical protein
MSVTFPEVRVGEPVRYEALSIFPLFAPAESPVEYLLSDEGISSGAIAVQEVSEGGSVPDLLVENKGDIRILFIEGEELIGAKQNRILNTSILVAAKSKIRIPVSCVEARRWSYKSRQFSSAGTHTPWKLRSVLKSSVTSSLRSGHERRSDQGAIWREVERQQASLGTSSGTMAMLDTFTDHADKVSEFKDKLRYVDGSVGVAVAIGQKVVALDLFDKPTTCQKVWNRLLSGFVLDALEAPSEQAQAVAADVEGMLQTARATPWEKTKPVGEGEEYRGETSEKISASALVFGELPIHLSVVAAT